MPLITRQDKGSKLSVSEMDNNLLYLQSISDGSEVILSSTSSAVSLIQSNGVVAGTSYLIKGVATNWMSPQIVFANGIDIVLTGVAPNKFSNSGYGHFYNPNYASYSVWDPLNIGLTFSEGDVVIFGGSTWTSITGTNSYSSDGMFLLNSDDWQIQGTSSNYYVETWDEIEYDITHDYINSRREIIGGNVVSSSFEFSSWWFCSVSPLSVFQWGNPYNGSTGNGSCEIINSYFDCLNFIDSSCVGINLNNMSSFANNYSKNSSISALSLTNESSMYSNSLVDSGIYDMLMSNTNFDSIVATSSTFQYIDMETSEVSSLFIAGSNLSSILMQDSHFYSMTWVNSNMFDIKMYGSNINDFHFDSSNFNSSTLRESYMSSHTLTNSSFNTFELSGSYLYGTTLHSSNIGWIKVSDSEFGSLSLTNSTIFNYDMNGFYIDYGSVIFDNDQLPWSKYEFNYIKYPISIGLNGGIGRGDVGLISTQPLIMPDSFFIYNIITDGSGLTYSGPTPNISIGLSGSTPDIIVSVDNLNKLNEFTFNDLNLNKSSGWGQIIVSTDNVILSGNLSIEVTLKNIKYNYIND